MLIYIRKDFVENYDKSDYNKYLLESTFFHERIHSLREINREYKNYYEEDDNNSSNNDPLIGIYNLLSSKNTEEIVTEALTCLFLSKVYGEEIINILKKSDRIDLSLKEKYKNLEYSKINIYEIGRRFGYILLNLDQDNQRKYALILIKKVHYIEDLIKILNDLVKDLPKNEQIIYKYDEIYDFINCLKNYYSPDEIKKSLYLKQ